MVNPVFSILPAEDRHLEAMMAVMDAGFEPRYGEAWSAVQLAATLAMPGCWGTLAMLGTQVAGFSLCRQAGPEVELLLIAVMPDLRRQGVAARLLRAVQAEAVARGASEVFLEVREDNRAARRLYEAAQFAAVGRRPDYYFGKDGSRRAAITMRFALSQLQD
ncbi:GNAT family N-acetyltransferase [Sandarakinorhabdus rubra]|uniref:GNAT family N-acetyltransferase n=1 Tax=Sandarakinorhabdus rubra TaxID=2672568 RepID=UPI001F3D52DB|nr:GNAT family N-acetyltransferase [Sandarakinorhabdus rubra]